MKYVPGPWIGVALPGVAILMEPGSTAEQIEALRTAIAANGVTGLVDALRTLGPDANGASIGFAAVGVRGVDIHIQVRGGASVVELDAATPRMVTSGGGAAPREVTWSGAKGIRLIAPGSDAQARGVLWLESGVVFAGSIDVDLSAVIAPALESVNVVVAQEIALDAAEESPATPTETMIPDFTQAEEQAFASVSAEVSAPAASEQEIDADADADAALDLTFGDIWGATLAIEDLDKVAPAASTPAAPPAPVSASPPAPAVAPPATPTPPAPPAPPTPPAGEPAPAPAPSAPPRTGLIDGIPDIVRGPGSTDPGGAVVATPHAPVGPTPAPLASATPPPAAVPTAAAPSGPRLGDHDGSTVSVAEMLAMQSGPQSAPIHTGSGSFSQRRRGRALVSTGQVIEIDKTIIVGRLPRVSRITGQPPMLVAVPSPQQDISRNHVEIRLEGSAVVVVDLNTTNGTVLLRAGADAERLHPGEPTVVRNGDVIDLGDNVTVQFEGVE